MKLRVGDVVGTDEEDDVGECVGVGEDEVEGDEVADKVGVGEEEAVVLDEGEEVGDWVELLVGECDRD